MTSTRRVGVLCTLTAIAAGSAHAGVTFTSQAAFMATLNSGSYTENFQSYADGSGHATPMNFAGGAGNAFRYQVTTGAQAFLCFSLSGNRYLTTSGTQTMGWSSPVTLTFTGAAVNAIGGDFFLTSAFGGVVNSSITLSFNDGSSQVLSNQSNSTFFGYVSTTTITSLTITPPATHHFVSIDNLVVGWSNVPTPGSAAMLGLCGIFAQRRRRITV